jgi:arylsulfatase A
MNAFRTALILLCCVVAMLGTGSSQLPAGEAEPRPNVILILLDDLGWADLSCYGSRYHRSPHIDRLAAEGMRFTQAYAAAPVCSPTRAALLTGKWPARLHITDWLPGGFSQPSHQLAKPNTQRELPLAEVTLAERLHAAGYATGHIGKWHLGGRGFGPRNQGFDLNVGGDEKGTPHGYFAPFRAPNGGGVPHLDWAPPGSYLTDMCNDVAIRFIREHRDEPFFLNLSHFAVHSPLQAKPQLIAKYKPREKRAGQQANPIYAAMIESVDEGIGRIVKELEKLQLSERTILIFTSDNGGLATAEWPFTPPTVNGSLREGKGYLYEGGIRVPLIVRWPGRIQAGALCDTPVTSVDFLPTILELCGVDKPHLPELFVSRGAAAARKHGIDFPPQAAAAGKERSPVFDGVSLVPRLKQTGDISREALYWHYPHYSPQHGRPCGAIRQGDYKLMVFYEDSRRELYNLKSDPGETTNLADQEPNKVRDLAGQFTAWRYSVDAQMMKPNPFYHPNPQQMDGIVSLHVRTASIHGPMLRFQSPPHLDALDNWGKQQDWVSFEFEVAQTGKFDLELLSRCRQEDAGSTVEITVGGQTLTHIVQVTDPGKFQARVIGGVELQRTGRHLLTIKPQTKPGNLVMDLRRVRLLPLK